jgi:hypothetical protein
MEPNPVMVGIENDPISPVILVELTGPVKVIPEPARTAKLEAEPRSTVAWALAWVCQPVKATTASKIMGLLFMGGFFFSEVFKSVAVPITGRGSRADCGSSRFRCTVPNPNFRTWWSPAQGVLVFVLVELNAV